MWIIKLFIKCILIIQMCFSQNCVIHITVVILFLASHNSYFSLFTHNGIVCINLQPTERFSICWGKPFSILLTLHVIVITQAWVHCLLYIRMSSSECVHTCNQAMHECLYCNKSVTLQHFKNLPKPCYLVLYPFV